MEQALTTRLSLDPVLNELDRQSYSAYHHLLTLTHVYGLNGSLLTGPYGLHREDGGQRTRDPEPDFISFRILLLTYKRFHQQMVA